MPKKKAASKKRSTGKTKPGPVLQNIIDHSTGKLSSKQQVDHDLELLGSLRALGAKVYESHMEYLQSNEATKHKRRLWDLRLKQLTELVNEKNDPQERLQFEDDGGDDLGQESPPADAPWQGRHMKVIGCPPGMLLSLKANHIKTLGDMANYLNEGKQVSSLIGFGPTRAGELADLWAEYTKDRRDISLERG